MFIIVFEFGCKGRVPQAMCPGLRQHSKPSPAPSQSHKRHHQCFKKRIGESDSSHVPSNWSTYSLHI